MTQSPTTSASILTIGHSNLELADFLAVLVQHAVKAVCDVRSRPGSFRFPQFNREPLEAGLASLSIRYEFLGDTLGGRPSDRACIMKMAASTTPRGVVRRISAQVSTVPSLCPVNKSSP